MKVTLEEFYEALKLGVKYQPDSGTPCLRLNGFRVLQQEGASELSADNMGATPCDKNKPYFYSRAWEKTGSNPNKVIGSLPVLTIFERQGQVKSPFDKTATVEHQLILTVWDKYDQDKCAGDCAGCAARTVNEIFRDTQTMLFNVLYYIGGLVVATTSADPAERVYHKALLEKMKTEGDISEYQVTGAFKNSMQAANKEHTMYRQNERTAEYFYGTAITIDFKTTICNQTEFDFNPTDYGAIAQEFGCKNCG